jgi:gliding motility-associated protein GldL
MAFFDFNKTRGYRNFMAKVYGIGASVVLIGALMKINHYGGADFALAMGLGTEALIFFLSAFEDPHVEPDWSLVYPELAGMYHPVKGSDTQALKGRQTATQRLDAMLEKAKIDQETIDRLGEGLSKFSENAAKMADVTDAAVASKNFAKELNSAAEATNKLGKLMEEDVQAAGSYSASMGSINQKVEVLANAYDQAADILKGNMDTTEEFAGVVHQATQSAKSLADSYQKSAEVLSKSVEALDFTAVEGDAYNTQLRKIAENLASLNAIYEIQLQGSNTAVENAGKMQETMGQLLQSLEKSTAHTGQFAQQMETLTQRMGSLNKVYGNMLTAMNIQA